MALLHSVCINFVYIKMINRIQKYLILAIVSVGILAGCAPEPNRLATGYGDVDITLAVDTTVVPVAGASMLQFAAPALNSIELQAVNESTGYSKKWASLDEYLSGVQKLPVGDYVFSSFFGDVATEGFVAPAFYGESRESVTEEAHTEVALVCALAHSFFSINCADVADFVSDLAIRVKSESGTYVTLAKDESRVACVVPGQVGGELILSDATGRSVALRPFAIENAKAGEHYEFRVSADATERKLSIVYDEATMVSPYELVVDDALFSTSAPSIRSYGFDADGVLTIFEEDRVAEGAGCEVEVPGGLKNLYLTVVSEFYSDNPWQKETDIAGMSAAALANGGIAAEGNEAGSQSVRLDFSELVSHLPSAGFEEAVHTIIVQAKDAAGRVSEAPAVLKIVSRPVSIALGLPSAVAMSANEATFEFEYNGSNPTGNLAFQYTKNTEAEWTTAAEKAIEELDFGRYRAIVAIPQGAERLDFRICYKDGVRYSNVVSLNRIVPNFEIVCNSENIWPSQADIIVESENVAELVPYLTVLVREAGDNWHPAVEDRDAKEGRITVSTLMPETDYEIMIVAADETRELSIKTEAALELPNADFEEWETTISMKGVNCGGKYSNLASWMPIYNKANIEVKEPKGWASVNGKTCSSSATTSNTWFQVPTTELIGKAYSGQYAVKLRNAAWDMHGVEPPRDARTDREYFSSNVPDIAHRSAGKLFLGSYSCDADGNETYTEGIEFASRPTALSGMYAYVQDVHDLNETGLVVIRILNDENGKVTEIGRGERRLSPSTSYTRFVVPIEYSVRDMRATKLQLMICSSNYASYSQADETRNIRTTDYLEKGVSTGAELTIDALSLLYE